jgi:hypothetical protein
MKYQKLAYYYSRAALLLMNSFIAIVALNVLLYAAFLLNARPVHQNVVEQRYENTLLRVTEPLYVDNIHYTAAMSRRLAEYIGGLLTQRKLLQSEAATRSKRE